MAEYVPAPSYPTPDYGAFGRTLASLPGVYRQAQQDQMLHDQQTAFAGGVPMTPQGQPDYAKILATLASKGDIASIPRLGALAQDQQFLNQAGVISPLLSGAGYPPPTAAPAPGDLPPASAAGAIATTRPRPNVSVTDAPNITAGGEMTGVPRQTPNQGAFGNLTGVSTVGANVYGIAEQVIPDPAKRAKAADWAERALGVEPGQKLTPEQAAKAQRYLENYARSGGAGGGAGNAPPDYRAAISGIESGGNYNAVGPVTRTGDRAYGKYQIMGANIPSWTKAALGRSMTPQEFLSDPKAQDAVFDYQFGKYVQQYGAKDAASMWLTGRTLANGGATARDQLGTTGQGYADRFMRGLGGAPAAEAISAATGGPSALVQDAAEGNRYIDATARSRGMGRDISEQEAIAIATGAPQPARVAQAGGRPVLPQYPLPPGVKTPQEGVLAIDKEIARLGPNPYASQQIRALEDWRNHLVTMSEPIQVGPYTTYADPRTGEAVYKGALAQGNMGLTPEAIDAAAEQYWQTGKLPPNMGKGIQGSQIMNAVISRAAEMHPDTDWAERAVAWQDFAAQGAGKNAGARTVSTREKNLELILRAADAAIPAALEQSERVARTGWVPLNKVIQAGQVVASDPELKAFGMANLQLAEHWARAMNPTGVMRESDRDKALSFLSTADSPETYRRAVMQLKTQIDREFEAVKGGGAHKDAAPSAAPSSLPHGWTVEVH